MNCRVSVRALRLVIVVAVGLLVGAAPASAATTNAWSVQPSPGRSSDLTAVSCWSANGCIGVGTSGAKSRPHSERWNGTSWTTLTTPAPPGAQLRDVACSARNACTAVGNQRSGGYAMRWNGKSWRLEELPGAIAVWGVSCWSSTGCVTVGGLFGGYKTYVARWNGSSWRRSTTPTLAGGAVLSAVSCGSARQCVAVGGTSRGKSLALRWNGAVWRRYPTPTPSTGGSFYDVSCWSAGGCMAVGDAGGYGGSTFSAQWNGASWSRRSTVKTSESSGLWGVSCWSASGCVGVGGFPGHSGTLAEGWDGRSWARQAAPGGDTLWDVSCWSAGNCIAVGNGGLRERYTAATP